MKSGLLGDILDGKIRRRPPKPSKMGALQRAFYDRIDGWELCVQPFQYRRSDIEGKVVSQNLELEIIKEIR
jgi:hypothetical protein